MFCLCVCLWECVRFPETGIIGSYELPCVCWELNSGPPKEQAIFLTTEPWHCSFSPSPSCLVGKQKMQGRLVIEFQLLFSCLIVCFIYSILYLEFFLKVQILAVPILRIALCLFSSRSVTTLKFLIILSCDVCFEKEVQCDIQTQYGQRRPMEFVCLWWLTMPLAYISHDALWSRILVNTQHVET